MSVSVQKTPDQMRQERAVAEYADYSFRLMTVKTSAGPRGLVYVTSRSGNTYTVTDNGRCTCPDFQRRNQPYGCSPCKHVLATQMFLNCGTATPEPAESAEDRKARIIAERALWD